MRALEIKTQAATGKNFMVPRFLAGCRKTQSRRADAKGTPTTGDPNQ
jgi:hypothetical protein